MSITLEAFEQAVIEFTHFKTRDSDALIFPGSVTSTGPSDTLLPNKSSHVNNNYVYGNNSSNYYDNSHDTHQGINTIDMNVIQYYFFRRYLIRQTQEAVAAALEDIVQYELILAPSSRLKWARAILASVETERNCSPVLYALTQPVVSSSSSSSSSSSFTTASSTSMGSTNAVYETVVPNNNIHYEWNMIKERINTAASVSSYVLANNSSNTNGTNNLASIHNYPHLAGWEPSGMSTEQLTNLVTLPDGLFGVIFRYIIHQLIKTSVPLFNQSSEYAAYLHMSCCIIEQYHKAMSNHQTILSSLPSLTLSALSRFGISVVDTTNQLPGTVSTQSATSYTSLTTGTSNSSSASNRLNDSMNNDDSSSSSSSSSSSGTALFSSSSLSYSANTVNTLSGVLDSLSRLELSMNDFDRLGVIGSGSYGSVYVWRLRTTGILYAVKEMDKKILKSKSSVHTVVRELACSLAASTPFICGFDFAFTTPTSIYMGMQFAPHGDLERWLLAQNTKRFDEITARYYIAQIIISLKHLHRAGVIHRDLKASNVLIDGSGNVVLTDHGLSVYAHRCSTTAPDYARVCWGQKPDSSDSCCLGCLQVSKLKEMQKIAERCEHDGLSVSAAGYVAAEVLRYRLTKDLPVDGSVPLRYNSLSFGGGSSSSCCTTTTNTTNNEFISRNSFTDNSGGTVNGSTGTVNNTNTNKTGAAAMPGSDGSVTKGMESTGSSSSSSSTANTNNNPNTNVVPAATATKSSSGFTFSFRNFMSGGSRSSSGNKPTVSTTTGTNPKDTGTAVMDIDNSIGTGNPASTNNHFKPSAHVTNQHHQGTNNYSTNDGLSRVSQMDAGQYQQFLNENGFTSNCGVSCLSGVSGSSRISRTGSRTDNSSLMNGNNNGSTNTIVSGRYSNHGSNGNTLNNYNNPILSPSVVSTLATLADDTIGVTVPVQQNSIHHMLQTCFVNPVVLVASDCHCSVHHDDSHGWYRGRAGTSAYWCPEMIKRDTAGDRISYGMEADWWSLGCLTYALMTGRSPFATGLGTSYDNAQTLEGSGKIHWPKGIFSRDAKDFIARLCTVDPARRLGSGNEGWRSVMNHPWFKGIDFALLEGRVLPSPSVPTYKISTEWKTIPDKIENQHKGTAAEEAAAAEAQARSAAATAVLSSEDEAIFRACTYTSPDLFKRAWLRFASMQTIESILTLPLEYTAKVSLPVPLTVPTTPFTRPFNPTGSRLHSSRTKYSITNEDMDIDNNELSSIRRRSQSESSITGNSPMNHYHDNPTPGTMNYSVSPNNNGSTNTFLRPNSSNSNNNHHLNHSMDTNETGPDIRTVTSTGGRSVLPARSLLPNQRRNPLPLHQNSTGGNGNAYIPRHSTSVMSNHHSTASTGIVSPPAGLGVALRNPTMNSMTKTTTTIGGSNSNNNNTNGNEGSAFNMKSNRIISRLTH